MRKLLRQLLQTEDYDVLLADDGQSAVDMVTTDHPDVVLLDVMMPNQDGLDVLVLVRRRSDVPVIPVSGLAEDADRDLGLELGADDYIVKPQTAGRSRGGESHGYRQAPL